MSLYYINTESFATATAVYLDLELTTKAPDGYYSLSGVYRQQLFGTLRESIECPHICDMVINNITTTDETSLGASDGTATIEFTTTGGQVNYSVNSVPAGVATSPLVLTSLSTSPYTIEFTDTFNCTVQQEFTIGTFVFAADYIMITYQFVDGDDLDIRARIVVPDIGQNAQNTYIGYGSGVLWPTVGDTILNWGYDNQGTGFESILIDLNNLKASNPLATEMVVDLRAFWWQAGTVGTGPVVLAATMWKGGSPVGPSNFIWTNPTAEDTFNIDSFGTQITLKSGTPTSGDRVAVLRYDLNNNTGYFDYPANDIIPV